MLFLQWSPLELRFARFFNFVCREGMFRGFNLFSPFFTFHSIPPTFSISVFPPPPPDFLYEVSLENLISDVASPPLAQEIPEPFPPFVPDPFHLPFSPLSYDG